MLTHEILQKYLEKKKSRSGYSMRLLAKDLDVSVSFLSRIFSGKKSIPYGLLLKIQKPLDIEPEVFENIRKSHTESHEAGAIPIRGKVQVQSELEEWDFTDKSALNILRHWYYLPILEFSTLKKCDGTPPCIARYLGLTVPVVEIALREMESLGLVKEKEGRFLKTKKKIRWGSAKSLTEIRRFHDQMMVKAQEQLRQQTESTDFERRLIAGITMTTSPQKIKEAKKKLSEFMHELANDLIADEGTEVYQLAFQFFPLTKRIDDE